MTKLIYLLTFLPLNLSGMLTPKKFKIASNIKVPSYIAKHFRILTTSISSCAKNNSLVTEKCSRGVMAAKWLPKKWGNINRAAIQLFSHSSKPIRTSGQKKTPDVQRIAVKAIIENPKNKILLLREANSYNEGTNIGKYLLPGGRIEVGEHYLDGLKREVHEETGLEVAVGNPVFVSQWAPIIKGVPHQIVGIFFACKALTNSVKLSFEHDHYVWIDPDSMAQFGATESDQLAVKQWQKSGFMQRS